MRKAILIIFTLFQTLFHTHPAFAVVFGNPKFLNPDEFLEKINLDASHPAHAYSDEIKKALEAVVLVGGRGSGVIVSPKGLMMTARHVIADIYDMPTSNCEKIPLFFHHEEVNGILQKAIPLKCERILINDFSTDYALLEISRPDGGPLPFAEPERDPGALSVGMHAIIAGHPHAASFEKGVKKITDGPLVAYFPEHAELPHFIHLIDTEGGNSGAPVLSMQGKVIGIHFRGIPNYGTDVDVVIDGKPTKIHRFNVAIPVPFLIQKHGGL
ncbi:serine protease [Bdellovibrionota bacterium FG-2]